MRIHYFTTKNVLQGGGIEKYTREVGCRLAARGHEITVFATGAEQSPPTEFGGMRIVWLPTARPYWAEKLFGVAMGAAQELLGTAPDLIHFHSVAAGSAASVLRLRGVPCLVQHHGIEWKRTRWGPRVRALIRNLERCAFRFGDVHTAVSKTQCEFYRNEYGVDCEYIPTAADIRPPAPPDQILSLGLQPQRYLLFASRLVVEKGAHHLVQAFSRLQTDVQLVLAGDGPESSGYVQQLRRDGSKDPRVRFLGHVSGRLLDELFSNALAFVQPSEIEGLAIALIEAMAFGNIAIASDIPENVEALGGAGLTFRCGDPANLAARLESVLSNPQAYATLGERARTRVSEHYSWDAVALALENLYTRSLCRRKSVAALAIGDAG